MPDCLKITKNDVNLLLAAMLIAIFPFFGFYYARAAGETPTLSVAVQQSLSVTITTDNFPNLTPGSYIRATSTLSVTTNNSLGWYVTLSGNNKTASAKVLNDGGSNEIPDPTNEWDTNGVSTSTSVGSASAAISAGADFLYFRVMSASGTVAFRSATWWGASDVNFNASQLWSGIPSSTNVSKIGNTNVSSGGSAALNTVQYYVDVADTQQTGTYTGGLTFTVAGN